MKKFSPLLPCLLLAILALAGCKESTIEGTGKIQLTGNSAVLLPPGHPGTLNGSTLILPAESTPPAVHYANCFAGVPALNDIGIGSCAGASSTFIGYAILPVNVNLGDTVLGSYRIRVEVTDLSLAIDKNNISGSNPLLGSGNCTLRGCPYDCAQHPLTDYPPDEFSPAKGFEATPTITGNAAGVTIEAVDGDTAHPTTGVVNLCNVRVNIVGELPVGEAPVSFSVDQLQTGAGDTINPTPFSGFFISKFRIQ
jgi:predicted small secreted protein